MEAFAKYCIFNHFNTALDVLLDHVGDLDRALEITARVDHPDVWLRFHVAQTGVNTVADDIRSIILAKDI